MVGLQEPEALHINVQVHLLLERTLAVVVELGGETQVFVFLVFNLCVGFLQFLSELLFLSQGNFLFLGCLFTVLFRNSLCFQLFFVDVFFFFRIHIIVMLVILIKWFCFHCC